MTKLTRTEQIIAEKTVCVLLVRGESPDGKKIFAYLALRADKLESFMEAQKQGTFFPEDFGIVLEAGEGEPSDEIKHKMTQEYGFNHEAMLDLGNTTERAHEIASNLSSLATENSDKK
ncbi:MAG: hypothetical protein K2Q01_05070 [Rickettsiales bacterium]|nr:hypothetical protein [Rickettsiales bacterium]